MALNFSALRRENDATAILTHIHNPGMPKALFERLATSMALAGLPPALIDIALKEKLTDFTTHKDMQTADDAALLAITAGKKESAASTSAINHLVEDTMLDSLIAGIGHIGDLCFRNKAERKILIDTVRDAKTAMTKIYGKDKQSVDATTKLSVAAGAALAGKDIHQLRKETEGVTKIIEGMEPSSQKEFERQSRDGDVAGAVHTLAAHDQTGRWISNEEKYTTAIRRNLHDGNDAMQTLANHLPCTDAVNKIANYSAHSTGDYSTIIPAIATSPMPQAVPLRASAPASP